VRRISRAVKSSSRPPGIEEQNRGNRKDVRIEAIVEDSFAEEVKSEKARADDPAPPWKEKNDYGGGLEEQSRRLRGLCESTVPEQDLCRI
jgi:hypothetical protein